MTGLQGSEGGQGTYEDFTAAAWGMKLSAVGLFKYFWKISTLVEIFHIIEIFVEIFNQTSNISTKISTKLRIFQQKFQ